jgi:hypothetical protein
MGRDRLWLPSLASTSISIAAIPDLDRAGVLGGAFYSWGTLVAIGFSTSLASFASVWLVCAALRGMPRGISRCARLGGVIYMVGAVAFIARAETARLRPPEPEIWLTTDGMEIAIERIQCAFGQPVIPFAGFLWPVAAYGEMKRLFQLDA